ncbi:hypothetical protein EBZ39_00400 [bacterium]|nr:hypothetical protein [bacterium]
MRKLRVTWYTPFLFFGTRRENDVREWGFRLDPRTEIVYYTYDWGRGITFVILGFGFDIVKLEGMH